MVFKNEIESQITDILQDLPKLIPSWKYVRFLEYSEIRAQSIPTEPYQDQTLWGR